MKVRRVTVQIELPAACLRDSIAEMRVGDLQRAISEWVSNEFGSVPFQIQSFSELSANTQIGGVTKWP